MERSLVKLNEVISNSEGTGPRQLSLSMLLDMGDNVRGRHFYKLEGALCPILPGRRNKMTKATVKGPW